MNCISELEPLMELGINLCIEEDTKLTDEDVLAIVRAVHGKGRHIFIRKRFGPDMALSIAEAGRSNVTLSV